MSPARLFNFPCTASTWALSAASCCFSAAILFSSEESLALACDSCDCVSERAACGDRNSRTPSSVAAARLSWMRDGGRPDAIRAPRGTLGPGARFLEERDTEAGQRKHASPVWLFLRKVTPSIGRGRREAREEGMAVGRSVSVAIAGLVASMLFPATAVGRASPSGWGAERQFLTRGYLVPHPAAYARAKAALAARSGGSTVPRARAAGPAGPSASREWIGIHDSRTTPPDPTGAIS